MEKRQKINDQKWSDIHEKERKFLNYKKMDNEDC